MIVNSIWFVGLTVLQMMPVYAEYADKLVTLVSCALPPIPTRLSKRLFIPLHTLSFLTWDRNGN